MRHTYQRFYDFCAEQTVVNTHSHYLPDEQQSSDLDWLLENAYVSWRGIGAREDRETYLRRLRGNNYYHWLERGLRGLTGFDQPLTTANWDAFSEEIRGQFPDAASMLRAMKDACRYRSVVLDAYWSPGSDDGHPELFDPAYRVNMYLFGWDAGRRDHNGNDPFAVNGWSPPATLEAYLKRMDDEIERNVRSGCSCLKLAAAYDRGLDFGCPTDDEARAAYGNPNAAPAQVKAFQDRVFHRVCDAAARLDVPLQLHTGLGLARRSNALQLLDAIERHPDTTFSLMHGGYPWCDDLIALTHNCKNVVMDLVWLPLLSVHRCENYLAEWIDVGDMDRITWGCDTWHCFESYGALLAVRHVLASVFSRFVDEGRMDVEYAECYIRHILCDNALTIYRSIR